MGGNTQSKQHRLRGENRLIVSCATEARWETGKTHERGLALGLGLGQSFAEFQEISVTVTTDGSMLGCK